MWADQPQHLVPDLVFDMYMILCQVKPKDASWQVTVQALVPALWFRTPFVALDCVSVPQDIAIDYRVSLELRFEGDVNLLHPAVVALESNRDPGIRVQVCICPNAAFSDFPMMISWRQ